MSASIGRSARSVQDRLNLSWLEPHCVEADVPGHDLGLLPESLDQAMNLQPIKAEDDLLISRMLANAFSGSSPFDLIEIGSNPATGRKAIRRSMIDNTLFALV